MASTAKALITHQRGVSRNRYTPPRYGERTAVPHLPSPFRARPGRTDGIARHRPRPLRGPAADSSRPRRRLLRRGGSYAVGAAVGKGPVW
ncbi:hypothetical protein GCM10010357_03900 [Streptomyces luteireticuli]|uniref:Uncharacterized protein n=1 Tax=Streptomyces luteireticuli TaxID=173858 RepID=A0ABP3I0C6_9ACTN